MNAGSSRKANLFRKKEYLMVFLRRMISSLLVLCLVLSLAPAAWAAEGSAEGGRILLDGEAFSAQKSVWVDGVEYPVLEEKGSLYVALPEGAQVSSLVTYSYHIGDSADVHTQYPLGMEVWALKQSAEGSWIPEKVEELSNILRYSGSSIRITGVKGIRMITSMEQDKKQALISDGLAGYKLLEYGTVLSWSEDLANGEPLILGPDYAKYNYAYKKGKADPVFQYEGNLLQYTNVLVGFSLEECARDISMRSYMILETPEGEQMTIYGGIVQRSIGYIAWQNRYSFTPGTAAYDYVWEIIRQVYGDISEVVFLSNGGTEIEPAIVENGTCLTKPANPEKDDLHFTGWYTDAALTKKYDFSRPVTECLILYAGWGEKPVLPDEPSEGDLYYFGKTEVLDIIPSAESTDIPTGAQTYDLLADRGFVGFPVTYDYTLSGVPVDEVEVPEGSANRFPMYETYYISASGDLWVIYVINGQVMANPVSFNLEFFVDEQVLFSEDGTLTSYDNETRQFYVTIPHSDVIMQTVDRIDAETLDTLTIEEIKKLW